MKYISITLKSYTCSFQAGFWNPQNHLLLPVKLVIVHERPHARGIQPPSVTYMLYQTECPPPSMIFSLCYKHAVRASTESFSIWTPAIIIPLSSSALISSACSIIRRASMCVDLEIFFFQRESISCIHVFLLICLGSLCPDNFINCFFNSTYIPTAFSRRKMLSQILSKIIHHNSNPSMAPIP